MATMIKLFGLLGLASLALSQEYNPCPQDKYAYKLGVDGHCYRSTADKTNAEAVEDCDADEYSMAEGNMVNIVIGLLAVDEQFMWVKSSYNSGTNRFHWSDPAMDNGKVLRKNGTSNGSELKLDADKLATAGEWCVEAFARSGQEPFLGIRRCSNLCPNVCKKIRTCEPPMVSVSDADRVANGLEVNCIQKVASVVYDDAADTCPPDQMPVLQKWSAVDFAARAVGAAFAWTSGYASKGGSCAADRYCWDYGTSSDEVTKWRSSSPIAFRNPLDVDNGNKSCIEYKVKKGPAMVKQRCDAKCPVICGNLIPPAWMLLPPVEVWGPA